MWGSFASLTRDWTRTPCAGRQSLNRWAKEAPVLVSCVYVHFLFQCELQNLLSKFYFQKSHWHMSFFGLPSFVYLLFIYSHIVSPVPSPNISFPHKHSLKEWMYKGMVHPQDRRVGVMELFLLRWQNVCTNWQLEEKAGYLALGRMGFCLRIWHRCRQVWALGMHVKLHHTK